MAPRNFSVQILFKIDCLINVDLSATGYTKYIIYRFLLYLGEWIDNIVKNII